MTIKETAGKILLYFYQLQRTVPLTVANRQLGFIMKKSGGVSMTSDKKWLTTNLQTINPKSTDILNAFAFLLDKGFLLSTERTSAEARVYVGIKLTYKGIDIIEGIEDGQDGKQAFSASFNIKVGDHTGVEELIAENLGELSEQAN